MVQKKLRFEVFRRDGFVCLYCGRHPPDVALEVDHLVPRAEGGADAVENLVTACFDCNRGKSDTPLDAAPADTVDAARVDALRERAEQTREYFRLVEEVETQRAAQVGRVKLEWCRAFRGTESADSLQCAAYFPDGASIRLFLKKLSLEEVLDAVHVTASRKAGSIGASASKYFYGVCHSKIRERGQ